MFIVELQDKSLTSQTKRRNSPMGLTKITPWTWGPWFFRSAVNNFTPGHRTWKSNSYNHNSASTRKTAVKTNTIRQPPASGADWALYLQQSEKQGHVLGFLDELVCEVGSQVICLFLGALICQGRMEAKNQIFGSSCTSAVTSEVEKPAGLFIGKSLSLTATFLFCIKYESI